MIKSILKELKACRAAWEANPAAKFAWCCHHEVLIEPLVGTPESRAAYILANKPEDEQAVRFRNFRPVRVALPDEFVKAWAAYEKTVAEYNKAWAAYEKTVAEYNKAWAAYEKATAEYDKVWVVYLKAEAEYAKARAEYEKARADHQKELERLHLQDCPDSTWNGKSIFA